MMLTDTDPKLLMFAGDHVTWYRPVTLHELLDLKTKYPKSTMVVGNSKIGEIPFVLSVVPTKGT